MSDDLNVEISFSPVKKIKLLTGTLPHVANAEPCCFWHIVQWQLVISFGSLISLYVTTPHRQLPVCTISPKLVNRYIPGKIFVEKADL